MLFLVKVIAYNRNLQKILKYNNSYAKITDNNESMGVENRMENNIFDLQLVTNYLIGLFYKTGKKYSCTRTKIGKLLSIFAFKYACDNIRIFKEDIYKYLDCGAVVKGLTNLDRDIYMSPQYEDSKKEISVGEINDTYLIPEKYKCDISSNEITNNLICVFRKFGAYESTELGTIINSVINLDGITSFSDEKINIEKFPELYEKQFIDMEDNELKNFLLNGNFKIG